MSGAGQTIAVGGLNIGGGLNKTLNRRLDNLGAAVWSGTGTIQGQDGAVVTNGTGAFFDIQTDADLIDHIGDEPVFNNLGALTKSAGAGTSEIQARFINSGTVSVQSGTLQFSRGGTSSGVFSADAGATLAIQSGFILDSASATNGTGIVSFPLASETTIISGSYSIATDISGGVVQFNTAGISVPSLTLSRGTLGGSGVLTVTGPLTWTGGAMNGAGQTIAAGGLNIGGGLNKTLNRRRLDNAGSAVWSGTGAILGQDGAVVTNRAGAFFDIQTDANFVDHTGDEPVFNNLGALTKSAGAGTSDIQARFTNGGMTHIQTGALQLSDGSSNATIEIDSGSVIKIRGVFENMPDGRIMGTGTLDVSGATFTNNGSIAPEVIIIN